MINNTLIKVESVSNIAYGPSYLKGDALRLQVNGFICNVVVELGSSTAKGKGCLLVVTCLKLFTATIA